MDNGIYDRAPELWWADHGFAVFLRAWVNPWRVPYFKRVIAERGLDPRGLSFLEVGCGGGILSEEFAVMGFAVTGLDPSAPSLEVARAHAAGRGLAIDYRLGRGEKLPFADASFQAACCCDVLEHIEDWQAAIGEAARVLAPGGLFLFDSLNRTLYSRLAAVALAQDWSFTRCMPRDFHVWSMFIKPAELKAALAAHGLACMGLAGTRLDRNPLRAVAVMRDYSRGRIDAAEFGRRMRIQEGPSLAGNYMGWAVKE